MRWQEVQERFPEEWGVLGTAKAHSEAWTKAWRLMELSDLIL
ncbi:hypothetical protein GCM10010911_45940 [Paenibacillus nasutitermitis]|uniref:Uncharacterized protein n=1 Tax=Paenibacillus nasutitermitis TaxID=1652958 RepID=A0A917DZU2_9BACL|nr:hypothetical protein GCM10010911_45940 [Paenibacillus nasutitermitis]